MISYKIKTSDENIMNNNILDWSNHLVVCSGIFLHENITYDMIIYVSTFLFKYFVHKILCLHF